MTAAPSDGRRRSRGLARLRAEALIRSIGLTARLGAATLAAAVLIGSNGAAAAASPASGVLPPKNPARSLPPSPDFLSVTSVCYGTNDRRDCNSVVLKAIAHARAVLEHMRGMSFSLAGYEKLTRPEQLFVAVDLERTERGLPPATVLTRSLDKIAQVGADRDEDPPLASVPRELPGGGRPTDLGGNWAGGWGNPLGADYGWMYDDGPGSDNLDCTQSDASGCWGHRDNILGTFNSSSICGGAPNELAMGAAYAAGTDSETELFAGVCGPAPTDVVLTWAKAKRELHIGG